MILQISGKTIESPWGLKVVFNKSLFTKDGDVAIRYFPSEYHRDHAYKNLKSISRVKSVTKIG